VDEAQPSRLSGFTGSVLYLSTENTASQKNFIVSQGSGVCIPVRMQYSTARSSYNAGAPVWKSQRTVLVSQYSSCDNDENTKLVVAVDDVKSDR
jgi:hypothetical protein